jgi:hypothetical protein
LPFTCGNKPLDRFIHEHGHQAAARVFSNTYVAVDEDDETAILGYYTGPGVVSGPVDYRQPSEVAEAALARASRRVGRTSCRMESVKGQSVASLMLMNAMVRCARVTTGIGGVAIIVDVLDEHVTPFYERVGLLQANSLRSSFRWRTSTTGLEPPERCRKGAVRPYARSATAPAFARLAQPCVRRPPKLTQLIERRVDTRFRSPRV